MSAHFIAKPAFILTLIAFLFSLTLVAGLLSSCASSGTAATVYRTDGTPVSGKLIAVNDGCVFIDTSGLPFSGSMLVEARTRDELRRRSEAWSHLRASTIGLPLDSSSHVLLEGQSYWFAGLLAGLGVSVIATVLTGPGDPGILNERASQEIRRAMMFLFVTPLAALLGTVLGAVASRPERTLSVADPQTETELRDASLIKDQTPRELYDLPCQAGKK